MNATTDPASEVGRYLEQVRAALADLPAEEREELLEDLPDHLALVLAEQNGTLRERLGPPEAYAVELRTAAGVSGPQVSQGRVSRVARVEQRFRPHLRRLDLWIGPVFGYPRAADLLRAVRPGWWVLRGYLVGLVVLLATDVLPGHEMLPPPDPGFLAWLLVIGACVVGSVRLGQVTPRLPDLGRMALTGGTLLLLFIVLVNFGGDGDSDSGGTSYYRARPGPGPVPVRQRRQAAERGAALRPGRQPGAGRQPVALPEEPDGAAGQPRPVPVRLSAVRRGDTGPGRRRRAVGAAEPEPGAGPDQPGQPRPGQPDAGNELRSAGRTRA
jgi:hypothetical protein